jgi:hypothetical protein
MLKGIRKNTKIIIWSVVFCFVTWGGYSLGTQFQKKGRVAGSAFGKDVSFVEYDRFFKASQIFSFGGTRTEDPERLKQIAWQNIILAREAVREKIRVSDDEVRSEILRLLAGARIENPTPQIYKRWVQEALKESPQEFEKQVREYLMIQKVMKKINAAPIEPATEEQILARYQHYHATLSIKIAEFATLEEARALQSKVKNASDWQIELGANAPNVRTVESTNLQDLAGKENISQQTAWRLYTAEPGSVSEPFQIQEKFGIALILAKAPADESKMDDAMREEYAKEVGEQKKLNRFLAWDAELMQRANLKDYLPASGSQNDDPAS